MRRLIAIGLALSAAACSKVADDPLRACATEADCAAGDLCASDHTCWTPDRPQRPHDVALARRGGATQLTWGRSVAAVTYSVLRASSSAGPFSSIADVAGQEYSDPTDEPNLFYSIVARRGQVLSEPSSPRQLLPLPGANLVVTVLSSAVKLSWPRAGSGGPYSVLRGTSATTLVPIARVSTEAYADEGLTRGATYFYAVSAPEPGGNAFRSPVVTAALAGAAELTPQFQVGYGSTVITWVQRQSGTYTLLRKIEGQAAFQPVYTGAYAYVNERVAADDVEVEYFVRATFGDKPGLTYEGEVSPVALPPGPVRQLGGREGFGHVALSWTSSAPQFLVTTPARNGLPASTVTVDQPSFEEDLPPGTWTYSVVAISPHGRSSPTSIQTRSLLRSAAANLGTAAPGPVTIATHWRFPSQTFTSRESGIVSGLELGLDPGAGNALPVTAFLYDGDVLIFSGDIGPSLGGTAGPTLDPVYPSWQLGWAASRSWITAGQKLRLTVRPSSGSVRLATTANTTGEGAVIDNVDQPSTNLVFRVQVYDQLDHPYNVSLSATAGLLGTATLSWPQANYPKYRVERSVDDQATWTTVATTAQSNVVDVGLPAGRILYRVTPMFDGDRDALDGRSAVVALNSTTGLSAAAAANLLPDTAVDGTRALEQTFVAAAGGQLQSIELATAYSPTATSPAAYVELLDDQGAVLGLSRGGTSYDSCCAVRPLRSDRHSPAFFRPDSTVSLVQGRTYRLRLRSFDGLLVGVSGDAYDGGAAFIDGAAAPDQDLAFRVLVRPQ